MVLEEGGSHWAYVEERQGSGQDLWGGNGS